MVRGAPTLMPRLEFNRATRRAIIERAKGHCEACSAVLKPGEAEIDHILPDALGGKPEAANGWLLCRVCHVEKTGHDIRRIRKADRQRDRSSGAIRAKATLKSRGFPAFRAKPDKLSLPGPENNPIYRTLWRRGEIAKPIGGDIDE